MRQLFRFGNFEFDPETPLLLRESRSLELSPKALRVLAVLVRNAGRVVSKDDLLHLVWPDRIVEEGNLAVHISSLRKALTGAATASYIETVPKRGYRFAAPLTRIYDRCGSEQRNSCRIAAHYLQQQTADGCRRAAAEYNECLHHEPRNIEAKIGMANTLLLRLVLGDVSREQAIPRVQALLEDAAEIDPSCASVYLSRSRWLCLGHWEWDRAQEELHRALQLSTSDEITAVITAWQGSHLVQRGEYATGIQHLQRALANFPLSPFLARFLADAHFMARHFTECVTVSRNALQLHPHCWMLHRMLGRALTALGEYGPARRCYRRALLLCDGPPDAVSAEVAYLDAVGGKSKIASNWIKRLEHAERAPQASIAPIHLALGETNRALDCIEHACANRDWSLPALLHDYRFDPLRTTPRFREVVAHMGM